MRYGPYHLVDRRLLQGLLVRRKIRQVWFFPAQVEHGGGVFRRHHRFTLGRLLGPLPLQLPPRQGQSPAGAHFFPQGQVLVDEMGQVRGVDIAYRCLHGQHRGNALLQQVIRQACTCCRCHAAVAGIQEDQGQGPTRLAQGTDQILCRHRHFLTQFVFQDEFARSAVAGEVQHVVAVPLNGLGDLGGMAHFQDAHLGVAVALERFHRVENLLQLPFVVQHGVVALVFVGRAHRHQHLERSGHGFLDGCGNSGQRSHHHHILVQGKSLTIAQAQGLPWQARHFGVSGGEHHLQGDAYLGLGG